MSSWQIAEKYVWIIIRQAIVGDNYMYDDLLESDIDLSDVRKLYQLVKKYFVNWMV